MHKMQCLKAAVQLMCESTFHMLWLITSDADLPLPPVFLTGTDRIPINGFERMGMMIQRMDGGTNFEKLPVAHTCFNILDLPPYPSKEKMRDKLLQATNLTAGFGII